MIELPYKKIFFLDFYRWRWLCEDKPNWHVNYLIDFVALDGVRYVLVKTNLYYAHGDLFSREFFFDCRVDFEEDKACFSMDLSKSVQECELCDICVPDLSFEPISKQYWDVACSKCRGQLVPIGFIQSMRKVLSSRVIDGFSDFGGSHVEQLSLFEC